MKTFVTVIQKTLKITPNEKAKPFLGGEKSLIFHRDEAGRNTERNY
jgi:hypothetical protein